MRNTYIQQTLRNQTFLQMKLLTLRPWFTLKSNPSSKNNGMYHILHIQYQEGLTTETWWWPHQILLSTNQYLISSYVSLTTSIHLQYLTSSVASSSATSTTAWQFQGESCGFWQTSMVYPIKWSQNVIRYQISIQNGNVFHIFPTIHHAICQFVWGYVCGTFISHQHKKPADKLALKITPFPTWLIGTNLQQNKKVEANLYNWTSAVLLLMAEIRQSPVEVGTLSHDLPRFYKHPTGGWEWDFWNTINTKRDSAWSNSTPIFQPQGHPTLVQKIIGVFQRPEMLKKESPKIAVSDHPLRFTKQSEFMSLSHSRCLRLSLHLNLRRWSGTGMLPVWVQRFRMGRHQCPAMKVVQCQQLSKPIRITTPNSGSNHLVLEMLMLQIQ